MPNATRRAALALAASALPALARAETWAPRETLRLINPFPPGGSPDILARAMAPHLQAAFGQSVVVENRPGAGATVGTRAVARAAADGHTVLVAPISSVVAPFMTREPGYALSDFRAVTLLAVTPTVLVTRPNFPARTVQEWHAAVLANPGRFTAANSGPGTPHQLAGELYRAATGADFTQVSYRGSAPALVDVRAGTIDFMFADLPAALGQVRQGALPALAVGVKDRLSVLPDVPTIAETILPGFEAYSWVMLWVPAATPEPVVARWNAAARAALAQPDVQARGAEVGFVLAGTDTAAAAAHLAAEEAKWGALIRARGLRFEEG